MDRVIATSVVRESGWQKFEIATALITPSTMRRYSGESGENCFGLPACCDQCLKTGISLQIAPPPRVHPPKPRAMLRMGCQRLLDQRYGLVSLTEERVSERAQRNELTTWIDVRPSLRALEHSMRAVTQARTMQHDGSDDLCFALSIFPSGFWSDLLQLPHRFPRFVRVRRDCFRKQQIQTASNECGRVREPPMSLIAPMNRVGELLQVVGRGIQRPQYRWRGA